MKETLFSCVALILMLPLAFQKPKCETMKGKLHQLLES